MNHFVITIDYLDGELGQPIPDDHPIPEAWVPFALHDDDNEPYYEGFAHEDYLEDLWSWGAAYAGTTLLYSDGELVIG
jgi:hypothetical protein